MGFGVWGIEVNIQGDKKLRRALSFLPEQLRKKVIKSGVRSAMLPALKMAKQLVPEQSGQLKASLKRFVRVYPSGVVAGFMGPSNKFKIQVTTKGGKKKNIDPSNYAHLVEYGHRMVVGGKLGQGGRIVGFVPPHPFMRDAFDATEQQMKDRFFKWVNRGLQREWRKLIRKAGA